MDLIIGRLYYFHAAAFLVSLYMAVLVLRRRPAHVNRVASLLFFLISLWGVSVILRHSPIQSIGIVRFFLNLGAVGWIGMPAVFLWFSAVLTGSRWLRGRKTLVLFIPSAVFLWAQFSGMYIMDVSEAAKAAYGWVIVYKSPFWINSYYLYLASFMILGLILLARRISTSSSVKEIRRIALIMFSGLFSVAGGFATDVALPLAGIEDVPGLGDLFALIWAAGMYRGITKYGLAEITPEAAADRIIETMSHSLFLTDNGGRIKFVNPAALELTAKSRRELEGRPFADIVSFVPEGSRGGEGSSSLEGRVKTAEGEIPVLITRSCMRDETGESLGWVCIVKDISEIRSFEDELRLMLRENVAAKEEIQKLLDEKDLLLHEVHHRNKNNMNVISSLLSLQALSMADSEAAAALNVARSRVRGMMIMYDKLYRSGGDFRTVSSTGYFSDLIDEIVSTYAENSSVAIEKRIEEIPLESKIVFSVGIIINELISNAFKYAFSGRKKGRILVSFSKNGETSAVLSVEDDGVGMPDSAAAGESPGFGLNLVRTLTSQIGGNLEVSVEDGTRASISFPL